MEVSASYLDFAIFTSRAGSAPALIDHVLPSHLDANIQIGGIEDLNLCNFKWICLAVLSWYIHIR